MAKRPHSPLKLKFDALPRSVEFKPELPKHGITLSTFYRDLKTHTKNIPTWRLQVYAALLNCDLSDLLEDFAKGVKPLVKKRVGVTVGLKN